MPWHLQFGFQAVVTLLVAGSAATRWDLELNVSPEVIMKERREEVKARDGALVVLQTQNFCTQELLHPHSPAELSFQPVNSWHNQETCSRHRTGDARCCRVLRCKRRADQALSFKNTDFYLYLLRKT